MAANCGSKFLKFSDFYYIYSDLSYFFIWDSKFEKIAFHKSTANPNNLYVDLVCTDYADFCL